MRNGDPSEAVLFADESDGLSPLSGAKVSQTVLDVEEREKKHISMMQWLCAQGGALHAARGKF